MHKCKLDEKSYAYCVIYAYDLISCAMMFVCPTRFLLRYTWYRDSYTNLDTLFMEGKEIQEVQEEEIFENLNN